MSAFELHWMGGVAERLHAAHRGDLDAMPWHQLDPRAFGPEDLDHARICWTQGAHQEWCAAAGFSALLTALLHARAPVDVIGMAGSFVADEMVHTELNARMAAAVGGGVHLEVDPARLCPTPEGEPLWQAVELALRVSCVGESFSLPVLGASARHAHHPLVRAVLKRIAADEAPHARLGWVVLDWALPLLSDDDRDRLGHVAREAIAELRRGLAPEATLSKSRCEVSGCLPPSRYAEVAEAALSRRIVTPLAARGIHAA
ncbi:MAG: ferritin-like domain-containing protein [Deltaproteobacteria bacterium]|nr:MAG: ferritin-like domain-containing protein [Deltaproteobacteria bacterium]